VSSVKTLCFDLDGTLCTNTFGDYESAEPFPWAIARVNALAEQGHRIIVFTARGTATGIDWDEVTRGQLERWGVRYDELFFGKPSADVYVDDRAIHTDSWRLGDAVTAPGFELESPTDGEQVPLIPPPACTAIVEHGRPDSVREHAERARARAEAAGIDGVPSTEEIVDATRTALERAASEDQAFSISIWDPNDLALELRPVTGLHVACRPLSEVAEPLAEGAR
jgi:hypothetical protein